MTTYSGKEIGEQKAFLLHSRPYRENQCIVDLITEYDGKVSAVTYLSQSKKSAKKSLLQPFLPLKVGLTGKSNLKKLPSVEAASRGFNLVGNYLYSGFYVNELIVRLLPEHVYCDSFFNAYQQTVEALEQKQPLELNLRLFEMALLNELGLAIDFEPVFTQDSQYFSFIPERGFIAVGNALNGKANQFSQQHLQAIANEEYANKEIQHTFKLLMRVVIQHLLGNKPLNSRKLFMK